MFLSSQKSPLAGVLIMSFMLINFYALEIPPLYKVEEEPEVVGMTCGCILGVLYHFIVCLAIRQRIG